MNRKDIIHIGVRTDGGKSPWYLSISETARREVRLPYHRSLRVRMGKNCPPLILPVEPSWQQARSSGDILVPVRAQKTRHGIVLGPIIAILTVVRSSTGGFRGNKANFKDIIKAGKRLGQTVVVCTPEGLRSRERMECFVYTGKGATPWKRAVLPLPNVVYNRVPDREAERRPEVLRVKKWLAEQQIPLFNNRFFDKAEIHDWLQGEQETSRYLPYTEALRQEEQIGRMLRRHKLVYVKPADGKAGDGIIQIRAEGKGYAVTVQKKGQRTRTQVSTRQEAAALAAKAVNNRPYLLQQGISLATYDGRQFDLRLLLQKNRHGHWRVTGMGARIADSDGITTHVPNGGRIEKAGVALQSAFGKSRAAALEEKVKDMALLIAAAIERQCHSEGQIGEMSMDIGVTADGTLYFFEANAKPMKFDEPYIRAKSLLRLLQYCEFLAEHSVT
ncbi:YheC/D-like protein [Tumebacillus sp. BK434]|uniref:YheC/YheD family endospore coat-associated protein n=1 Tax=Tumebacillus sp. BK434 TaxID=2512169 RepID=UPI0010506DE8|nr:YheC/YheD family protein [Tumebacillus sp. BK434]TCP58940.1 YheC/D-like protein [Tumebacillus sp. BK434]